MMQKRARNIIAITGLLLITHFLTSAQTDIGTTSHWYNRANYNPASIARPDYIYLFSNVRKQWVGVDGAPTVYNIQASGFAEGHNSALGISMIRDDIGVTTALNPSLQYAYRVGVKENAFLSFGLSVGMYSRKINASLYEPDDINDPLIDYTDEKFTSPDANFGMEFQAKHFIAGLSATHLFSIWKPDDQMLISNHRYAYALYRNSDSELLNITTGVQVMNRNNLTVVEGTAIFRVKKPTGLLKGPTELFDIGLTLRSVKEMTLITGINLSRNLRVGYTYDFGFNDTYSGNGTHEIILEYRIPLHFIKDNGYPWYD